MVNKSFTQSNLCIYFFRPSMSQGTVIHKGVMDKDFTVGTPEEFVRRFKGTRVINKVIFVLLSIFFVKKLPL